MGRKLKVSLETAKKVIISEILSDLYAGIPYNTVYIEGTMGIGKSTIYKSIVNFLTKLTGNEWGLLDLRFATLSASDIQGIPHPVQQEDGTWVMKWMKDATFPGINKTLPKYGIVLMDEINQVKEPAVKSIMYQFILDKKINDYTLPDTWYQGCAGNREEDGGIYDRLLAPVRDRMMILEIKLNAQETLDYFKEAKFHPVVIDYIESNLHKHVNVLHTYNPELEMSGDEECENYLFCTPRTYEFVSNVLYSHERLKSNGGEVCDYVTSGSVLKARICGLMGEKEGTDFYNTYKVRGNFDLQSIFEANWVDDKPDRKLPTLNDMNNNSEVGSSSMYMYIIESISAPNKQKEAMAVLKWLCYIKAPSSLFMSVYNLINNENKVELKADLLRSNCNEMANIMMQMTNNVISI